MKTANITIRRSALAHVAVRACVAALVAATAVPAAMAQAPTPFEKAMAEQRKASAAAAVETAAPAAAPQQAATDAILAPNAPPPAPAPKPAPVKRVAATPKYQARAANQTFSGETALSCRNINWKKGDIIRLQAQPFKQVHVTLPEHGMDVIMGDKELWALDWINNQLFIKPTSRSTEGRSTTISAIGQSGNAYEFVVNRVPEEIEIAHCVYVNADPGVIARDAWTRPDRLAGESASLSREVSSLREQNDNIQRQSRDSLKSYRKKLNSNYTWSSGGFFSKWAGGEVESVYDDGRFTYIRMKEDSQSLISIMGDIDGKAQLLEYAYDSPSRTYQISGIFPKFSLRNGDQTLTISRK